MKANSDIDAKAAEPILVKGFTLLELLVVLGILSILMTGIGVYHFNQNAGGRLAASVRLVSALANRAKMQAVVSGNPTRLMIDEDPGSAGYLAMLVVAQLREGVWESLGQCFDLPRGIRVIPQDRSCISGKWERGTSVFSEKGMRVCMDPDGRGEREFVYIEFLPGGMISAFTEQDYLSQDIQVDSHHLRIFMSEGVVVENQKLRFDNPGLFAGLTISLRGDIRLSSNP